MHAVLLPLLQAWLIGTIVLFRLIIWSIQVVFTEEEPIEIIPEGLF